MMSGVVDDLLHLNQRRAAYEAVLKRYGDVLPNAAELSDMVHRELAKEALWVAARAYDRRQTDTIPVEELVAFAFDCWPAAASLSTYRSLQWRRRVGPAAMPYLQPLVWPRLLARQVLGSRAPGEGQAVVARMRTQLTHMPTRRLTEGTPW